MRIIKQVLAVVGDPLSEQSHSFQMAPATHTCSDPPALTNPTDVPFDAEGCRGIELKLPKRRAHHGRRGLDTPATIMLPVVPSKRKAEQELSVKARAENLVREPVFITAVVLTALILMGGFIVTKLGHRQLPRGRPRNCERLGRGASSSSTSLSAGPSASPASPSVQELCPQTPVQHHSQPCYMPADHQPPSSPFSPPSSPMPSHSPAQASPNAGAVRPDVYIHEASAIPQIVQSQPHGTFRQIEDWANADEIGNFPVAIIDTMLGSESSPSLDVADAPERWTCAPEQASEASDHSTEETSPVDLFSSGSSISSLTSASDAPSDLAELDDDQDVYGASDAEFAFEVKRGHAQSMELAKGRLMSWGPLPDAVSSQDMSIVGVDAEQDNTNLKDSRPVRIPIPALIITEPSTLSLFTAVSSTSNLSIDLAQFPILPLCLEPAAFWQKLDDEINSSLALKQRRLNH